MTFQPPKSQKYKKCKINPATCWVNGLHVCLSYQNEQKRLNKGISFPKSTPNQIKGSKGGR